jgi:hypothetical protein
MSTHEVPSQHQMMPSAVRSAAKEEPSRHSNVHPESSAKRSVERLERLYRGVSKLGMRMPIWESCPRDLEPGVEFPPLSRQRGGTPTDDVCASGVAPIGIILSPYGVEIYPSTESRFQ